MDRALRLINRKGQGSIPSQGCLLNCEDLFHSNFILLSPNKHTGLCSPFISWFGSVGLCRCLVVLISNNFFIFAEAATEQSGLQCKRSSFLVVEVKININKLNRRHKAKTNGVEGGSEMKVEVSSFILPFDLLTVLSVATIKKKSSMVR